jgi:hypothetical protein
LTTTVCNKVLLDGRSICRKQSSLVDNPGPDRRAEVGGKKVVGNTPTGFAQRGDASGRVLFANHEFSASSSKARTTRSQLLHCAGTVKESVGGVYERQSNFGR